jgi:hypothetical protein
MKSLQVKELIQLWHKLRTCRSQELLVQDDQLKIHQLKTLVKMRELQLKNLVQQLNLKKGCQPNQTPKLLKEQLELLDQVTGLQLKLKFKTSNKKKL